MKYFLALLFSSFFVFAYPQSKEEVRIGIESSHIANQEKKNHLNLEELNHQLSLNRKEWLGKIKWLSFPRLERYSYGNEFVSAISILEDQMYPIGLNFELYNDQNGVMAFINKKYNNNNSTYSEVQSTEGYKLEVSDWVSNKSPQWHFIDYQGGKLDPTTLIELHDMSNLQHPSNWVGYFIDYPQKVEEAIPEQNLEHIWMIKAQDWAMVRDGTAPYGFIYKGKVRPLECGDMIEIYSINDQAFSWNQAGKKDPVAVLKTTYYQNEEKLDYEPVFVLMDESSDVQEVAIKANGEVIGAAVREAGDTIVQVCTYLEGVDPDTQLELETYSGGKGTNLISDYLVLNKKSKQLEKRKVYAGEKAMYQVVSINPKDEGQLPSPLDQLEVYPVPTNESLSISFLMNKESQLQLTIYNNLGQVIDSPLSTTLDKGYYTYQWDLHNQQGERVPSGIYFYRIDFPEIGVNENGKIIVQ